MMVGQDVAISAKDDAGALGIDISFFREWYAVVAKKSFQKIGVRRCFPAVVLECCMGVIDRARGHHHHHGFTGLFRHGHKSILQSSGQVQIGGWFGSRRHYGGGGQNKKSKASACRSGYAQS